MSSPHPPGTGSQWQKVWRLPLNEPCREDLWIAEGLVIWGLKDRGWTLSNKSRADEKPFDEISGHDPTLQGNRYSIERLEHGTHEFREQSCVGGVQIPPRDPGWTHRVSFCHPENRDILLTAMKGIPDKKNNKKTLKLPEPWAPFFPGGHFRCNQRGNLDALSKKLKTEGLPADQMVLVHVKEETWAERVSVGAGATEDDLCERARRYWNNNGQCPEPAAIAKGRTEYALVCTTTLGGERVVLGAWSASGRWSHRNGTQHEYRAYGPMCSNIAGFVLDPGIPYLSNQNAGAFSWPHGQCETCGKTDCGGHKEVRQVK